MMGVWLDAREVSGGFDAYDPDLLSASSIANGSMRPGEDNHY